MRACALKITDMLIFRKYLYRCIFKKRIIFKWQSSVSSLWNILIKDNKFEILFSLGCVSIRLRKSVNLNFFFFFTKTSRFQSKYITFGSILSCFKLCIDNSYCNFKITFLSVCFPSRFRIRKHLEINMCSRLNVFNVKSKSIQRMCDKFEIYHLILSKF